MANNKILKDGSGVAFTTKTTEDSNGVNTPHVNIDGFPSSNLVVSSTGTAGGAITTTLPAVAGLFHLIDAIEITLYSAAARVGAAAPITITTTNLPGNVTWLFPTAGAIGIVDRYDLSSDRPIKSSVVNTATTIVCPAVVGGIWKVNVIYSTGT